MIPTILPALAFLAVSLGAAAPGPCPQDPQPGVPPPRAGTGRSGNLVIPPPPPPDRGRRNRGDTPGDQAAGTVEGFERHLLRLRAAAGARDEELVMVVAAAMAEHPDALERFRAAARTADLDLLRGIVRVLARHPGEESLGELEGLLRNRNLGGLARPVLEAGLGVAGTGGKDFLLRQLENSRVAVREQAADLLARRLTASDLPRLMELSHHRVADVRRQAVRLLGRLPVPEARARLLKALSEPMGGVASAAREALALAAMEDATGTEVFTRDMAPWLQAELRGPDGFRKAAAAVGLASLLFRSTVEEAGVPEREVVEVLVEVVAARTFFSEYHHVLKPAQNRLELLSGRRGDPRPEAWVAWWEEAGADFRGRRLSVRLDAETARTAALELRSPRARRVVLGVDAPAPAAPPAGEGDAGSGPAGASLEVVRLEEDAFLALVEDLRERGFMGRSARNQEAAHSSASLVRVLTLRSGASAVSLSAPEGPARWFDPLEERVEAVLRAQVWQLYRDPSVWPAEEAFLGELAPFFAEYPLESIAGRRRLKELIVATLPFLGRAGREGAARDLARIEGLPHLLESSDGAVLVEAAASFPSLEGPGRRLLELAAMAPGEQAWEAVLSLVEARWADGGRDLLSRLFHLQGLERVLSCLSDRRPAVRAAAAEELAGARDPRAVSGVVRLLSDPDPAVRRSAVFAAGRQRSLPARPALLDLARGEDADLRREALVALGRTGGEEAFEVLMQAAVAEDMADRVAAVRGLSQVEDPRAARVLVAILATHHQGVLGQLAAQGLRDQHHLAARSDLRQRLVAARDAGLQRDLVFLLAEGMDPLVVPDLLAMLERGTTVARCLELLAGLTGMDFSERPDRVALYRQWWERNKDRSMGDWLLEALAARRHHTALRSNMLQPMAGPAAVPELARLLEDAQDWYLRTLALAVLREVTGRDFGAVRRETPPAARSAIAERYRALLIAGEGAR